ncbi:MAG: porin family protein [Flavisolibacter sp.]
MNRIILLFTIMLISFTIYSQEAGKSILSFGIKAGPGMTKFNVKQPETSNKPRAEWKITYHAGLFARIPIAASGKFAIQPEILYSRNGARISETGSSFNYQLGYPVATLRVFTQVINYINIPLMLQFGSNSGVYAEAGPQMSFMLNAKQHGPDTQEYDHTEQRNKQDIGWGFGAGHISKKGFALGFRYNQGTKDIIKEGYAINGREYRNASIFLNMRWFIPVR